MSDIFASWVRKTYKQTVPCSIHERPELKEVCYIHLYVCFNLKLHSFKPSPICFDFTTVCTGIACMEHCSYLRCYTFLQCTSACSFRQSAYCKSVYFELQVRIGVFVVALHCCAIEKLVLLKFNLILYHLQIRWSPSYTSFSKGRIIGSRY